ALPPFDRVAMDGYALRAADTAGAAPGRPVRLRVAALARAGHPASRPLGPGEAARVFTGAALPAGADAVVRQEQAATEGEGFLRLERPLEAGSNVDPAGSEAVPGYPLLPAGTRLGPAELGLAANLGLARLAVRRRPRVILLSTGAELVEPGGRLGPGQIYSSNRFALAAMAEAWGARAESAGIVDDDAEAIALAVRAHIGEADLLVTSGGASVGDYDCMAAALERLGAERLFHGVALKPGTPVLAAKLGDGLLLGLPGTPGAAYTTFRVLAVPLLRVWQGLAEGPGPAAAASLPGVLDEPPRRASERLEQYLAVRLRWRAGRLHARPLGRLHATSLLAWLGAGALARVAPGPLPPPGAPVELLPLLPWEAADTPAPGEEVAEG
ncbi:MAG: molybdopterin molybdotransferase MoeA, partial [Clostridia bacterium]|nr:molybdopterin molybdotransferase MoeA [Clostridia bacterium]